MNWSFVTGRKQMAFGRGWYCSSVRLFCLLMQSVHEGCQSLNFKLHHLIKYNKENWEARLERGEHPAYYPCNARTIFSPISCQWWVFLFPFVWARLWYSMRGVWSATLKPNIQFLLIHKGEKDQVVQLGGDASSRQLSLKRHVQTIEVICHQNPVQNLLCVSHLLTWHEIVKLSKSSAETWLCWHGQNKMRCRSNCVDKSDPK